MRNSLAFMFGAFVSRTGDAFSFLAFVLLLTASGASNSYISLFMVFHYLPGVVFGLTLARYFDHIPKRITLVCCYIISALLLYASSQFIHSPEILLALSGLLGMSYGLYVPLQKAFLGEIFPKSLLKTMNTRLQLAEAVSKTIGFGLAGTVYWRLGPAFAFFLDALSFLVIAASLLTIRSKGLPGPIRPHLTPLLVDNGLVRVSMIHACTWLGTGALFALEASYARTYLAASDQTIGVLFACATTGALTVPLLFKVITGAPTESHLTLFALVELVFVATYGVSDVLPIALVGIMGYGLALAARNIQIANWIQAAIPVTKHGSAFAFQQSLANMTMLLGMGLSGPLSTVIGIRETIVGAVCLSVAMIGLIFWRRPRAHCQPI